MPNAPPRAMACTTPGSSGTCRRIPIRCRSSLPSIAGPWPPTPPSGSRVTLTAMADRPLDLIAIGRAAVDLYGEQIGGPPANTVVGAARLGLKCGMVTRVGDEHMGRFVRETLAAEGVDVAGVKTDPDRLTALVILGIQNRETFPLIFYRENCADMGIEADDIDPALLARA